MTTQAKIGYGAALKRGDGGAPENFTQISEVQGTVKGPGISVDVKDATNQNSAQAFKEKIAGLIDAGQLTFDINWDPGDAQHAGLVADCIGRVVRNFQWVLPPAVGLKWSFAAIVSKIDPSVPTGDKMVVSVTLDITGPTSLA